MIQLSNGRLESAEMNPAEQREAEALKIEKLRDTPERSSLWNWALIPCRKYGYAKIEEVEQILLMGLPSTTIKALRRIPVRDHE